MRLGGRLFLGAKQERKDSDDDGNTTYGESTANEGSPVTHPAAHSQAAISPGSVDAAPSAPPDPAAAPAASDRLAAVA